MQGKAKFKGLLWSSELQYHYKYSLTESEVCLYHIGAIGLRFINLCYYSTIALTVYACLLEISLYMFGPSNVFREKYNRNVKSTESFAICKNMKYFTIFTL